MIDLTGFRKTQYRRRTFEKEVPASLVPLFGGAKTIVLQSLTGHEVFLARDRVSQNLALAQLAEKLLGNKVPEVVEGVKQKLGLNDDLTSDEVYRVAVLEFGVEGKAFDQSDAVKLKEYFPTFFMECSNKIIELTGVGHTTSGESKTSGEMPA